MRSRSMQSLTDAVKRRHPGVVVYGKGDAAHALRASDHNEDDTAGSRPAQTDADSNPEHRAIDIMLGPNFSRADAYVLIADLLGDPAALARLTYLIFDGHIWSASRGWVKRVFDGDDHSDHIHASGDAADDENAAPWAAVEGDDMNPWVQHVMNYRLEAVLSLRDVVKVPAVTLGGKAYAAFSEPNVLAATLKAQNNPDVDEAKLAELLKPFVRDTLADLLNDVEPSDGPTEDEIRAVIDDALNRARITVAPAGS